MSNIRGLELALMLVSLHINGSITLTNLKFGRFQQRALSTFRTKVVRDMSEDKHLRLLRSK